jgi:hypothetical protein
VATFEQVFKTASTANGWLGMAGKDADRLNFPTPSLCNIELSRRQSRNDVAGVGPDGLFATGLRVLPRQQGQDRRPT